ncbi:hypothetical protein AB5I41_00745 [Sphingomonas sp. MMS24-JH45]
MSGQGSSPIATHHAGASSAMTAFFQSAISRVRASSIPPESSSAPSSTGSSDVAMVQPMPPWVDKGCKSVTMPRR